MTAMKFLAIYLVIITVSLFTVLPLLLFKSMGWFVLLIFIPFPIAIYWLDVTIKMWKEGAFDND